jgi:hypothetical protein
MVQNQNPDQATDLNCLVKNPKGLSGLLESSELVSESNVSAAAKEEIIKDFIEGQVLHECFLMNKRDDFKAIDVCIKDMTTLLTQNKECKIRHLLKISLRKVHAVLQPPLKVNVERLGQKQTSKFK